MGAMHDFFSGLIAVRNNGLSLPEIVGRYQGKTMQYVMRIVTVVMSILVGVVFMRSPASILNSMITSVGYWWWIGIILVYYIVATILPIDKIIAKCYPIFGAALIFMALGLLYVLFTKDYVIPELDLKNYSFSKAPIIPTLFITIACGAISGFHATQSPLMARCVNNETECRMVFYGSMITESIIALIWAAVAMAFFGGASGLNEAMSIVGHDAPWVVNTISKTTMGVFGGILAILGVVAAPITSGDTAFRAARLVVADSFGISQKKLFNKFIVVVPMFAIAIALLFIDFDVIWRYFSWTNQAIACVVLWTIFAYLRKNGVGRSYIVATIPAVFMTFICSSFVFVSNQFIGLGPIPLSYIAAGVITLVILFAELKFSSKEHNANKKYKI